MMMCCVTVAPSVSAAAAVRFSHSATDPQMPSSSQQQQPRHAAASVSTTRYSHITGPQVTAASRAQLMPFILGVNCVFMPTLTGAIIVIYQLMSRRYPEITYELVLASYFGHVCCINPQILPYSCLHDAV